MPFLLSLSRLIDGISNLVGKLAMYMILAATLISAGNAIVRKLFNVGSNSFLEIQWYLFAAVFMLGGGYAFMKNVHVRIDFLSSKFSPITRNWVDVGGILFFLFPLCYLMATMGWPVFANAWESGEMSSNAGGLIRWPVRLLIPMGFALLAMQGVSELIKRLAFIMGQGPDALSTDNLSDEELLAQELALEAEANNNKVK